MKVILVNPPDTHSLNCGFGHTPPLHVNSPPLGLMYIKSYLNSRLDAVEVRLFNFQVPNRPSWDDFAQYLKRFQPDVVGITVMTFFWYDTCEVIRTIKGILPDAIIVGGGPHMWVYPEESLVVGGFDIVVQGDGETTFFEVLNKIKKNESFKEVKGIFYKNHDGKVIKTPARNESLDIDNLPFPDRSDFDIKQYRMPHINYQAPAIALASRGCPYRCTFCNNLRPRYKKRSVDLVVKELWSCKKMGYDSIMFYDDVFTCSRQHVLDLCKEIIKQQLNLPWMCQTRVDCVDRELVRFMVEAGCKTIQMGVESGNQNRLFDINKQISLEQCRKAFSICREAGLVTVGYFIIGFPGETSEEAKRTFAFAEEVDADYVVCSPLFIVPGTQMFKEAEKDPLFDNDSWKRFILNPKEFPMVELLSKAMPAKEMERLINTFYRRYYLNPRRILKYLKRVNSLEDLIVKVRAGRHVLGTGRGRA